MGGDMGEEREFYHRNCTYILPGRSYPKSKARVLRERTHGCWCSSWREIPGGFQIWRDGKWAKPKAGELRRKSREH